MNSFNELCSMLELNFQSTMSVLESNDLSLSQAKQLAGVVEEARLLLLELEHALGLEAGNDRWKATIYELRNRYLHLEGILKERRNDLHTEQ